MKVNDITARMNIDPGRKKQHTVSACETDFQTVKNPAIIGRDFALLFSYASNSVFAAYRR